MSGQDFTDEQKRYLEGFVSGVQASRAAAGLKASKTGVTFSPNQPIPDALVKKLAVASKRDQKV